MLKQVESTVDCPESLLRSLELELAARRAKRPASERQRLLVLAGGLLLLVGGGAAALFFLFNMVSELPRPQGQPDSNMAATAQP